MFQKLERDRIVRLAEFLRPLRGDVAIAQRAKVIKKRCSLTAHPFPVFVGINGAESIRHGTAPAQGNAQIMDSFVVEAVGSLVGFLWYLVHPMNQARVFANWALGSHQQSSLRSVHDLRLTVQLCSAPTTRGKGRER